MPSNQRRKSAKTPKGTPVRRHNYSDIRPRKKKTSLLGPFFVLFLLALLISLIVAAAWQKLQDSSSASASSESNPFSMPPSSRLGDGPASPSSIPSMKAGLSSDSSSPEKSTASSDTESSSSVSSNGEGSDAESSDSSGVSSESPPAGGTSSISTSTTVPLSQKVSESYFEDALFIGDSITLGIESYGLLDTTVIAHTGINPSTMMTSPVYELSTGEEVTLLEAAKQVDAKKIYVMIGANGISWIGKEGFISYYTQIVEQLKADHPDAIIYVQSILPVTKALSDENPSLSNVKIDDYNVSILEMAEDLGVYYLNVAECIKDSTGALPHNVSPNDGIHFGPSTYQKWFDYLLTHVVDAGSYSPASSAESQSSSSGSGD